jgi:hypothetical protein
MSVIIWQQYKRSVEEILYDFNAENMQEKIQWLNSGQLKYRKQESLQMIFHILLVLLTFIFYYVATLTPVLLPQIAAYLVQSTIIYMIASKLLFMGILSVTFIMLMWVMKHRHYYEYIQSKKSNYLLFLFIQLRNAGFVCSLFQGYYLYFTLFPELYKNMTKEETDNYSVAG